jgi:hypothetical protein
VAFYELTGLEIDFVSLTEPLDLTNPTGREHFEDSRLPDAYEKGIPRMTSRLPSEQYVRSEFVRGNPG